MIQAWGILANSYQEIRIKFGGNFRSGLSDEVVNIVVGNVDLVNHDCGNLKAEISRLT